jgi:hypothetical protein
VCGEGDAIVVHGLGRQDVLLSGAWKWPAGPIPVQMRDNARIQSELEKRMSRSTAHRGIAGGK